MLCGFDQERLATPKHISRLQEWRKLKIVFTETWFRFGHVFVIHDLRGGSCDHHMVKFFIESGDWERDVEATLKEKRKKSTTRGYRLHMQRQKGWICIKRLQC